MARKMPTTTPMVTFWFWRASLFQFQLQPGLAETVLIFRSGLVSGFPSLWICAFICGCVSAGGISAATVDLGVDHGEGRLRFRLRSRFKNERRRERGDGWSEGATC